jgi:hypothetical protein
LPAQTGQWRADNGGSWWEPVNYSLGLETLPRKCHCLFMANQTNIIAWLGRVRNGVISPDIGDTGVIARDQPRRGAMTEIPVDKGPADTWVDELQWLSGFPGNWGERRGGWFCGF